MKSGNKVSPLAIAAGVGVCALGLKILAHHRAFWRNKSVLITGGSRGLGLALAEATLRRGAQVAILARDEGELERAKRQLLRDTGREVLAIVCDVTDQSQVEDAVKRGHRHHGRLDVLINNAGMMSAGPFDAMEEGDFEASMGLHFFAVLKTVRAALPFLRERRGSRIVNISSIGGKIPVPHMAPYCASKFALAGLTQAMAIELRKDGIRVTGVYPGLMRTGSPMQVLFKGDREKEYAWFALGDSIPGLTLSAASAARRILRAVESGRSEAVLSLSAKAANVTHALFPETFTHLLSLVNRALPQDTHRLGALGSESRGWLDGQSWSAPFRAIQENAERKYNQRAD